MEKTTQLHRPYNFTGTVYVIVAACAFSAKAVLIKLAYGHSTNVDPITLMALRMAMAAPFFVAVALWQRRGSVVASLSAKDWGAICLLGTMGYYLASFLDFVGLQYISAGLERLLLFLYPTFVVLLSSVFLKRKISSKEVWALLLSYGGILFVFLDGVSTESSDLMFGSLLILASAVSFAVFLMGSAMMIKRMGSTRFTAYSMLVSCLVTLAHYSVIHPIDLPNLPKTIYGLAFLLATISTVIPAFLMNAGIRRIGASRASIMSSVGPISTIILAYFLLDEAVTSIQLLGTALVLVGVYQIGRTRYTA